MMNVLRDIAGVELPGYVAKLTDAETPAAGDGDAVTLPAAKPR